MKPNDIPILLLAVAGGALLGFIFFGGLWWTVRRGVASPNPAMWFFFSLMLRMGLIVIGFYVIGGGRWQRIIACLIGFFAARFVVMRIASSSPQSPTREHAHAPHA